VTANANERMDGFSPFWPLVFLSVGLGIVLLWTLIASSRSCYAALRARDQQGMAVAQAVDAEGKFKALVEDLLVLAGSDAEAKAVVDKYQIRVNTPPAPAPIPIQPAKAAPRAAPAKTAPHAVPAAKPAGVPAAAANPGVVKQP
jgi:hypothetical protein